MNTMTTREVMMTRKAVETQIGAAILKGCKAEVEVTLRGSAGDKVELTISGTKAAVTKALAYVTAAPLSWVLSGTSDDDEDKDGRIDLEVEGKVVRLDTTDYAILFDEAPKPRLTRLIDSLPQRFRWTPHNLIAHPLSEVLFQLGFEELGNNLHDVTVPTHEKGTGRG